MFGHIVPCGIPDKRVTSLAAEGVDVSLREVVDAVAARAAALWGGRRVVAPPRSTGSDVVWRHRPDDLSAFSRGEAATPRPHGRRPASRGRIAADRSRGAEPAASAGRSDGVPVRLKGRLAEAGVTEGLRIAERKPDWLRLDLPHATRRTCD